MTTHGRYVLLALLLVAAAALLAEAATPPPLLGPPLPARACEVPVEFAGRGIACLSAADAARASLAPGRRLTDEPGSGGSPASPPAPTSPTPPTSSTSAARMAPARLELFAVAVDLNTAPVAELESLPNIGPALAARIVAARPFESPFDIRRVRGIGAAHWAQLKSRLTVAAAREGR